MVIGENEKFPAAFIIPAFAFIKDWCSKHNINYTTNEEMILNKEIIDRIWKEVENANKDFAQYEQIKKIELLSREWTVDKGEMTPKLSLKRKIIMAANKAAYDKIYGGEK